MPGFHPGVIFKRQIPSFHYQLHATPLLPRMIYTSVEYARRSQLIAAPSTIPLTKRPTHPQSKIKIALDNSHIQTGLSNDPTSWNARNLSSVSLLSTDPRFVWCGIRSHFQKHNDGLHPGLASIRDSIQLSEYHPKWIWISLRNIL